jgi:hypothetical protein
VAETVARTLLYALVAAASPIALTATLGVLHTHRARLNGFIFAAAFVLGSVLVIAVVYGIGAAGPSENDRSTFADALELLLGILLLSAAWRVRHGLPARRAGTGARTQAVLERLARLTPAGSFWIGAALGIGGPKRLTVTILAATTIGAAGLSTADDVRLSLLYLVVASVLVWAPVAAYLIAGARARRGLERVQASLKEHQHAMTMGLLLVFGVVLTGDALAALL